MVCTNGVRELMRSNFACKSNKKCYYLPKISGKWTWQMLISNLSGVLLWGSRVFANFNSRESGSEYELLAIYEIRQRRFLWSARLRPLFFGIHLKWYLSSILKIEKEKYLKRYWVDWIAKFSKNDHIGQRNKRSFIKTRRCNCNYQIAWIPAPIASTCTVLPHLVSCDFFLFSRLKKSLSGKKKIRLMEEVEWDSDA